MDRIIWKRLQCVSIFILFFFSLSAQAESLKVDFSADGKIGIKVNEDVCLQDLTFTQLVKPEWKGHYIINWLGEDKNTTKEGLPQDKIDIWEVKDKEIKVAILKRVVEEKKDEILITWELKAEVEFPIGYAPIEGYMPAPNFAGKGIWYKVTDKVRIERFEKNLFPESISDSFYRPEYLFFQHPLGNFISLGWLSRNGTGIDIKPGGVIQWLKIGDSRPGRGTFILTCGIEGITLKKNEVLKASLHIKPINNEELIKTAFKADDAMLYPDISFAHLSQKENKLTLKVRNLIPLSRNLLIKYKVTDDILRVLKEGTYKESIEPMGEIEKEMMVPAYRENKYRVFLEVFDEENKVDERLKMAYRFNIEEEPRYEVLLSGEWERLKGNTSSYPPKGDWERCVVPLPIGSGRPRSQGDEWWYRLKFSLPEEFQGKRIKIKFEDIRHEAQIYLNGKKISERAGAYTPCSFDITDFVQREENLIEVALKGKEGFVGILADVWLIGLPKAYVEDTFIIPSVKKKEITVKSTLINEDSTTLRLTIFNDIYDKEGLKKSLIPKDITLTPGEKKEIEIKESWENPDLWWPNSPHLYRLVTSLKEDNKRLDLFPARFGFREVWCEKDKLFLNSVPIKMIGSWTIDYVFWWEILDRGLHFYSKYLTPEEEMRAITKTIERAKELNHTGSRFECYSLSRKLLDEADESGYLFNEESALYDMYWFGGGMGLSNKEKFWKTWAVHLREVVKLDRNHPSVILYSTGNEFLNSHQTKENVVKAAELFDVIREVDYTRPLHSEGGVDPEGKADIINIHYGREPFQGAYTALPNESFSWLNEPTELLNYGILASSPYKWQKDKPLYMGEMSVNLWDPRSQSLFLGDKGYEYAAKNPTLGHIVGNGEVMKFLVDAYRYNGVTGIALPGIQDELDPKNFQPICVRILEYNHNFYGGNKIKRTLYVLNDLIEPEPAKLRLLWQLKRGERIEDEGKIDLSIKCGDIKTCPVEFIAPDVSKRSEFTFDVSLYRDKERIFFNTWDYTVFPKISISLEKEIGVYDPIGKTTTLLERLKIKYIALKSFDPKILEKLPLLLIGDGSLDEAVASNAHILDSYVAGGGKIICLQQKKYPEWLPIEGVKPDAQKEKAHATTISFLRAFQHPILEGIKEEDLKFWAPDNVVSSFDIHKPNRGNFTILIDTGSMIRGLHWTSLLEIPYRRGYYYLCQLNLVDKFYSEPVASQIFSNLLKHALKVNPRQVKEVSVLTERESELRDKIDSIGLAYHKIKDISKENLADFGVLLIDGQWGMVEENKEMVREFVKKGGKVWLHSITPENIDIVKELIQKEIWVTGVKPGPIFKTKDINLFSGLSNHELWWPMSAPGCDVLTPAKFIIRYRIGINQDNNTEVLTEPSGLIKVNYGDGFFLLDQILWDKEKMVKNADRFFSILTTNLGAEIKPSSPIGLKPQESLQEIKTEEMSVEKMKEERLVGWWRFNESEGDIAIDSSPYEHTGRIYGNPKWIKGIEGYALEFDGADDYVEVPIFHPQDLHPLPETAKEMSISAWVKVYKVTDHGCIINQGEGVVNPAIRFRICMGRFDNLWALVFLNSGNPIPFDSNNPVELNQWTHVAMVADGERVYFYINGELDCGFEPMIGPYDAYSTLPIRMGISKDNYKFQGAIDDVRIYYRALSEREVKAHYKGG